MEGRNKCLTFRIVLAALGILSGVAIFACYAYFKNFNAAIWGLLSAVFSSIILRMHIAYKKDNLLTIFPLETLRFMKYFGVFASFAAIVAAVIDFTLAIVLKQGYKMENDGYLPAGIFSLLTLKWTFYLFRHSRNYEKLYSHPDGDMRPITNDGSI